MSTWEMMHWLIEQARQEGYWAGFQPFKLGEKVGSNSHYRFIWLKAWWVALFGDEYREIAHKALDVAFDEGPQKVIEFMYKERKAEHAKEKNNEEKQENRESGS